MRTIIHLGLHVLVPLAVGWLFFRPIWVRAFLIMLATMCIDVDHLLANPIFDPNRCSVGFHPLHTWPAIVVYSLLLLPRRTRLIGFGLIIHIALDSIDCALMR